jgi:hypothetical protein
MNADESTDASGSLPASCSAGVRFESMLIAGIFHFYAPPCARREWRQPSRRAHTITL